jgi:hypothetical protein
MCVSYGSHIKQRLVPKTALTGWALWLNRNVFPVRYKLSFYLLFRSHSVLNEIAVSRKSVTVTLFLLLNLDTVTSKAVEVSICTTSSNKTEHCILLTQCVCVLRMVLTINSDCLERVFMLQY